MSKPKEYILTCMHDDGMYADTFHYIDKKSYDALAARVAELIAAIKEADNCSVACEGVGLEYWMKGLSDKRHIDVIRSALADWGSHK